MKHAAVSWEAYWGDFALVFGSMLVLFSLLRTKMTEQWTRNLTVFAACFLVLGAVLTAGHDVNAYGNEHFEQAVLAVVVLVGTFYFLLRHFLRANRTK